MKRIKLFVFSIAIIMILSACSLFSPEYKEGVFEGVAYGFYKSGEPIKISVAIDSTGKIREIVILNHSETEKIGGEALKDLAAQVLNSEKTIHDLKIDNISNATETSQGFKEALLDALEKAKK